MSVLRHRLLFSGQEETAGYYATLFDSGATHSFVQREVVEQLREPIKKSQFVQAETAVVGSQLNIVGHTTLSFVIGKQVLLDLFYVVDDLTEQVIIGAETLQKFRIKLDFELDQVFVSPSVSRIHII